MDFSRINNIQDRPIQLGTLNIYQLHLQYLKYKLMTQEKI